MKSGEKAILRCGPEYAYGAEGSPPKIPCNATLDFEVELLKWDPRLKGPEEMTVFERSQHVDKCKELGNNAFKNNDWGYAIFTYEEGLRYISFEPGKDGVVDANFDHGGLDQINKDHKLAVNLLTNLAACFLKTGEEEQARDKCSEALNLDPNSVKALFRRGQAHLALGNYELVLKDIARLLELEPENKAAEQMRRSVEAGMKKSVVQEKAMFSKMFVEKPLKSDEVVPETLETRGRADPETIANRKIVRARRRVAGTPSTAAEISSLQNVASEENNGADATSLQEPASKAT